MELEQEKKEFGIWWLFVLSLVVITIAVFAVLGYTGKVTGTIIENKVFQESYQRKSGLNEQRARYQAELERINYLLRTDPSNKTLGSQKMMLETQLKINER